MGISGIRARTASAAGSSIKWVCLRPGLSALMLTSVAVLVASVVTLVVCLSGVRAPLDGPDVNGTRAGVGQPETSDRAKWTPAKAAVAAAGVAGLGTASWWAYSRYRVRKPEPERAVDKASNQAVSPQRANLKAHMTKANAMTAAKKGVSVLGFDAADAALMAGMTGYFEHQEPRPRPVNVTVGPEDMSLSMEATAGFPYISESRFLPANTTGEKLDRLRDEFGRNAVFYVIQSITLNPMGIADRMHVIDAVLRHVRSGDLASTDEGGCTTLRSIIDLALEDLVTFDQRMPVVAAFLRHNALSADIINHPDDNGFTVLHSIVIEITFPSTRPGRVQFLVNIANMLLDNGADCTIASDIHGYTPRSMVIDAISRCPVGCPAGRETLVALLTRMDGCEQDVPVTTRFNDNGRRFVAMQIRNHAADIIECFTLRNRYGFSDEADEDGYSDEADEDGFSDEADEDGFFYEADQEVFLAKASASCVAALDDIPRPTSEALMDAADGHPGLRVFLDKIMTLKRKGSVSSALYKATKAIKIVSMHKFASRSKSQEAALWARLKSNVDPFVHWRTELDRARLFPQEHLRVDAWLRLYVGALEPYRRMLHMFEILAGGNGPKTKVRMVASFLRTDIRDDVYTAVFNVAMGGGPVLMKTFQELASSFVDPAMAAKAMAFFNGIRPMPRADLDFQLHADFADDVDRILPKFDRDHAIGGGSIAEGHRTEYNGKPAFAKVKRCLVEAMFKEEQENLADNYWKDVSDLDNLDPKAYRLQLMQSQGLMCRARMVRYLQPIFLRAPPSLSFTKEASAMRFAADVFAPLSPRVKVPAVLLSTANVIVMSLAPGDGTLATWRPSPLAGGRDVCDLVGSFEMFARAWFENMLFSEAQTLIHTDMHPGNFMYKYVHGDRQYRESGLTVVDWGQHIVMPNGVNRAVTSKILAIVIGCLAGNLDMVIAAVESLPHRDDGTGGELQLVRDAFAVSDFERSANVISLISRMFFAWGPHGGYFDTPQRFLESKAKEIMRVVSIGTDGIASLWRTFDVLEKRLAQAAPSCPCTMPTFAEFVWKHAPAWVVKFTRQQAETLYTFWNGGNVYAAPDVALKPTTFADLATGRLISSPDARRGLLAAGRALVSLDPKKLADVPGNAIRDATAWAHRSVLDRLPVRMHPFLVKWSRVFGAEIAYQSFKHVVLGKKPSQHALTKRSFSKMLLRNAAVVVAIDAIEQGLTSQRKKLVMYLATRPREPDETTATTTTKGSKRPWLNEKTKRVWRQARGVFDVFYMPYKSMAVQHRLVNVIRAAAGL